MDWMISNWQSPLRCARNNFASPEGDGQAASRIFGQWDLSENADLQNRNVIWKCTRTGQLLWEIFLEDKMKQRINELVFFCQNERAWEGVCYSLLLSNIMIILEARLKSYFISVLPTGLSSWCLRPRKYLEVNYLTADDIKFFPNMAKLAKFGPIPHEK